MLTTDEISALINPTALPMIQPHEDGYAERNALISGYTAEWAEWLHTTYAPELSLEAVKMLLASASESAHYAGYYGEYITHDQIEDFFHAKLAFPKNVNAA